MQHPDRWEGSAHDPDYLVSDRTHPQVDRNFFILISVICKMKQNCATCTSGVAWQHQQGWLDVMSSQPTKGRERRRCSNISPWCTVPQPYEITTGRIEGWVRWEMQSENFHQVFQKLNNSAFGIQRVAKPLAYDRPSRPTLIFSRMGFSPRGPP